IAHSLHVDGCHSPAMAGGMRRSRQAAVFLLVVTCNLRARQHGRGVVMSVAEGGQSPGVDEAGPPSRPTPPTGSVSLRSLKPAMSGRALVIACCTAGNASEALWLASLSQTSVIQMASGSAESLATM